MRLGSKKEPLFFIFLVLLSGSLYFSDQKGWLDPARGVIEKPVLAVERKIYSLNFSISSFFNFFSSRQTSEQELMRLEGQLRQLALDQSKLSVCLEENEKMRQLLGAPLPPQWHFLPANVVALTEKIRLDKGLEEGAREGLMVVSENILVGRVESVEAKSSLVQTASGQNVKIPVLIKKPLAGTGKVVRAAEGIQAKGLLTQSGRQVLVEQILQSEDVQVGDLVLTSGEADWLPNLLIGQVSALKGKGAALYQTAEVSLLLDYRNLRTVFVVTDW